MLFLTQRKRAVFDEKAECLRFQELLDQQLPDRLDQRLLQIAAGAIFYPSARHEVALVMIGPGGTSKFTIGDCVKSVLVGPVSNSPMVTALEMKALCNPDCYGLANLKYSLVNMAMDMQALEVEEGGSFKKIVSGDRMEVRMIRKEPQIIRPKTKLWFATNDYPRFKRGSNGEERRMRFLLSDHVIPPEEQNSNLKSELDAERDGILQWMLDGLLELQRLGHVPDGGESSLRVKEQFAMANDPLSYFVKHFCIVGPHDEQHIIEKERFTELYHAWADENGMPRFEHAVLMKRVQQSYRVIGARVGSVWNRRQVLRGLRLNKEGQRLENPFD